VVSLIRYLKKKSTGADTKKHEIYKNNC